MNSLSTCPQTGLRIYTGGCVALSAINVQNNRGKAYDWLFCYAHTHSAHEKSSAINVQEPKRLVALTLNLVSVQPCAGRENKKREKVEIINFRDIKVPGYIPVIQYTCIQKFFAIWIFSHVHIFDFSSNEKHTL